MYRRAWSDYNAGNLPLALTECSAGGTRYQDPKTWWYWEFRLLKAEVLTAKGSFAEADSLLESAAPAGFQALEARRLVDQATRKLGRPQESAALLDRARRLTDDPELAVRIRMVEGVAAYNARRLELALAAFGAAAEMAQQHHLLCYEAQALNNQSGVAKNLGRYENAVDLGQRSLAIAEKSGCRRFAALAHGSIGSANFLLGDIEQGLVHEQQAVSMLEVIGDRTNLMITVGELGLMYDSDGHGEKAIANYKRAYQIATDLGRTRDAARQAENLAWTLINGGQWDAAAEWNDRAADMASRIGAADMVPYLTRNRGSIALGRGQFQESARIGRELLAATATPDVLRWEVYADLGKMDAQAGKFSAANQEFESALRIIDGNRSALADSHFRITLLSHLIPFYQYYVDALVQQNDDAKALRIAESSRARVLSERLGGGLKLEPLPSADSPTRLARTSNAVLLSFWLAPRRSYAWLITAGGVQRFQLPSAGEIEKLVTGYREVVEHALKDPILTNDQSGPDLWNALMAQIAPQIPKNSRVIVIPDGALHQFNLETLVAPAPQPHYWIEDVEIAVAPSIAIAASKPASKPAPPIGQPGQPVGHARPVLLIGNPDYSGSEYPPLKNAGNELSEIQRHFAGASPAVYTGVNASPAAYRDANPGQFSLIHFAAHADANREKPLESAVILSHHGDRYKLYAHEVIDIPIQADLVTISACKSAGIRSYNGEGLIGFAWAFLQAGARQVVAGLWDVSDSSTEPLMDRFYGALAAGQSPIAAMRIAKLSLKSDARFSKPFYWGPFQVYIASAAR